jgi:hypothetical protein
MQWTFRFQPPPVGGQVQVETTLRRFGNQAVGFAWSERGVTKEDCRSATLITLTLQQVAL